MLSQESKAFFLISSFRYSSCFFPPRRPCRVPHVLNGVLRVVCPVVCSTSARREAGGLELAHRSVWRIKPGGGATVVLKWTGGVRMVSRRRDADARSNMRKAARPSISFSTRRNLVLMALEVLCLPPMMGDSHGGDVLSRKLFPMGNKNDLIGSFYFVNI